MRYRNALSVLAGAVVLTAWQAAPPIHVDAAKIFRDVETLSADDMQGRLAGSPGGEKARAYVLARLKDAGVAPLDSRFERPFTFSSRNSGERKGVNGDIKKKKKK